MERQGPVLLARTCGVRNWHTASHFRSGRPLAYSVATGTPGPQLRASSSLCATMIAAIFSRLGRVGMVLRSGTEKTQGRESYESYEYPALVLTSALGAAGALVQTSRPQRLKDLPVFWILRSCSLGCWRPAAAVQHPDLLGQEAFVLPVEHPRSEFACSEQEVQFAMCSGFGTAHLHSCCCCPVAQRQFRAFSSWSPSGFSSTSWSLPRKTSFGCLRLPAVVHILSGLLGRLRGGPSIRGRLNPRLSSSAVAHRPFRSLLFRGTAACLARGAARDADRGAAGPGPGVATRAQEPKR